MPTEEDIQKAVEQIKRELESPEMAQAFWRFWAERAERNNLAKIALDWLDATEV